MASRSRKSSSSGNKGGSSNSKGAESKIRAFIWFIVIGGLVWAFFAVPVDPGVNGVIETLESKSENVGEWAQNTAGDVIDFFSNIFAGADGANTDGGSAFPSENS